MPPPSPSPLLSKQRLHPFESPKLKEADQIRHFAHRRRKHRDVWIWSLLRTVALHITIAAVLHIPIVPDILQLYLAIPKIWLFSIGYLVLTLMFSYIVYAAFYVRQLHREMRQREQMLGDALPGRRREASLLQQQQQQNNVSPSTPSTPAEPQSARPSYTEEQLNMLGLSQKEINEYWKQIRRPNGMRTPVAAEERQGKDNETREKSVAAEERAMLEEQMDTIFQSSKRMQDLQQAERQTPSFFRSSPLQRQMAGMPTSSTPVSRLSVSPIASPASSPFQAPITSEHDLKEYLRHSRNATPVMNDSSPFQQQQQQPQPFFTPSPQHMFQGGMRTMSPVTPRTTPYPGFITPTLPGTPRSPYFYGSPYAGGMQGTLPGGPMKPSLRYRMSPKPPVATTRSTSNGGDDGAYNRSAAQSNADHAVNYERQFEQALREWRISEESLQQAAENLKRWLVNKLLQPLCEDVKSINNQFKQLGFGEYDCNHDLAQMPTQDTRIPTGTPTPANGQYTLQFILQHNATNNPLLQRRLSLEPYLNLPMKTKRSYVVSRICELAGNGYLANYKWDSGVDYEGRSWTEKQLPTDTDILMHLFCVHMDTLLPKDNILRKNFRDRYLFDLTQMEDSEQALRQLQSLQRSDVMFVHEKRYPPHTSIRADGKEIAVLPGRYNLFYCICLFLYYHMKEYGAEDEMLSATGLRSIFA